MTTWEQDLAQLTGEVAWPATPDLATGVLTRVSALPAPPRPRRRWRVAVACAMAVVLPAGTVLAVSSDARDAVRDLLGIEGVDVRLVDTLPPAPTVPPALGADLRLGEESSAADAKSRLPFRPLVPRSMGVPDAWWIDPSLNQVSLIYAPRRNLPQARETGVGLLIMEQPARLDPVLFAKLRTKGTRIIRLRVRGAPAVGLEGAAHVVMFKDEEGDVVQDRTRLATNVLLIQQGEILIRMEASVPVRRMARIAESLRPI